MSHHATLAGIIPYDLEADMHQIQSHFLSPGRLARTEYHDDRPSAAEALRDVERAERAARRQASAPATPPPEPLSFEDRSGNELRPRTFEEMVGQDRLRGLLRRIVANAQSSGAPLDHMLLVGASGTGKTTLAMVMAYEMGRRCFMLKSPVGFDTFCQLQRIAQDGDIVILDEIHLMVQGDRRGVQGAPDPETVYQVLEDARLVTPTGVLPFPRVTFIGATTDGGLLPEPLLNRFPLSLTLDPYSDADMFRLALANAAALGCRITDNAAAIFARASQDHPRTLNTFVKNARSLGARVIARDVAIEVVCDLNGRTLDGLTIDQQNMLRFLLRSRREDAKGNVVHQASVNTLATMLGHSRDSKFVSLFVEPELIRRGLVAVTHGGRQLSDAGIQRALELT